MRHFRRVHRGPGRGGDTAPGGGGGGVRGPGPGLHSRTLHQG